MCGLRFTTYERIQTTALMVAKRDGRREEYNRDKLTRSVQMACVKRPLPTGAIDKLVDDIESQLQALGRAEIPSVAIGEMVSRAASRSRPRRVHPLRQRVPGFRRRGALPGRRGGAGVGEAGVGEQRLIAAAPTDK